MLVKNGSDPDTTKIRNAVEVSKWVKEAVAVDDATAKITFNDPRPCFMFSHLTSKFDTGIYIVPEHIYKDVEDVSAYQGWDAEAGLPVCTGPYRFQPGRRNRNLSICAKIGGRSRRASWPKCRPCSALMLPTVDETTMAQMVINNELDSLLDLRAATIKQVVEQNEKVITHTGRDLPMGYTDWWPTSFWFNCDEGAFADKNVRWAVSLTIDRQQMLDVALEGSGV